MKTNKEKFLAGEVFKLEGLREEFGYKESELKNDGFLADTSYPFGGHIGNVEYITPTRVEIYSYWMGRKLCKVIKYSEMNFISNDK